MHVTLYPESGGVILILLHLVWSGCSPGFLFKHAAALFMYAQIANICEDLVSLIKCILKKRSLITFILRQLLKENVKDIELVLLLHKKTPPKMFV